MLRLFIFTTKPQTESHDMPWNVKQRFLLTLFGVVALVLAIVVWIRHRDIDTDILATGLFFGGLAMIIIALPNGWNSHK